MFKGFIYIHTSPEGKSYIGQTTSQNIKYRYNNGNGYHIGQLFGKKIKEFGWDNFTHILIKEIHSESKSNLRKKLYQLEEDYIIKYNTLSPNGYNLMTSGIQHLTSIELRETFSKVHKGRSQKEKQKQKISQIMKNSKWFTDGAVNIRAKKCPIGFYPGRTLSEETLQIYSERAKRDNPEGFYPGRKLSEETKRKISIGNKGKPRGRKGIKLSEETKEKLRQINLGCRLWNNGIICKKAYTKPGDEWVLGRLPNKNERVD